jgi:hypothetical protein
MVQAGPKSSRTSGGKGGDESVIEAGGDADFTVASIAAEAVDAVSAEVLSIAEDRRIRTE